MADLLRYILDTRDIGLLFIGGCALAYLMVWRVK